MLKSCRQVQSNTFNKHQLNRSNFYYKRKQLEQYHYEHTLNSWGRKAFGVATSIQGQTLGPWIYIIWKTYRWKIPAILKANVFQRPYIIRDIVLRCGWDKGVTGLHRIFDNKMNVDFWSALRADLHFLHDKNCWKKCFTKS